MIYKCKNQDKIWASMISMLLSIVVLYSAFGQNEKESIFSNINDSFVDNGLFLSQPPIEKGAEKQTHFSHFFSIEEESKDQEVNSLDLFFPENEYYAYSYPLNSFLSYSTFFLDQHSQRSINLHLRYCVFLI